jgi:hypothetical protein
VPIRWDAAPMITAPDRPEDEAERALQDDYDAYMERCQD